MNLLSKCLATSIAIESVLSFSFPTMRLGKSSICSPTETIASSSIRFRNTAFRIRMSEEDEDDFYADYDPSAYSQYEKDNSSFRGGGGGGRGDGGYGYGRGHGYTRDTSRDQSPIDESAVEALIQERVDARQSRDYDRADAIREQLLVEYAVGLYDKEKKWRTGASQKNRVRRKVKDFGPNGHDYFESEDAGPNTSSLEEFEVHQLLAERLQAKMRRDFNLADRIQNNLIQSGVFVHDGQKEWRADGVPFGDLNGGRGGGPGKTFGSRSHRADAPYTKSPHSPLVQGIEERLVDALLMERQKCKMARAYQKADAIREGLRNKYNVLVDDRLKEWSVGGDFGPEHNAQREAAAALSNRGYVKSTASYDLSSPEEEEHVVSLVEERSVAKKERDYDTADAIREELRQRFEVTIDDKLKQWSVGGSFGSAKPKPRGVYTRRGGGDLSPEDVAVIEDMIKERFFAKKDRDYDTADEIRDRLMETYNVRIDDRSSEWHVDSADYVQVSEPGTVVIDPSNVEIITEMIKERHMHKVNREYEAADLIRDELNEKFGVMVDDRLKEWRCVLLLENDVGFGTEDEGEAVEEHGGDFESSVVDEMPVGIAFEED